MYWLGSACLTLNTPCPGAINSDRLETKTIGPCENGHCAR